MGEPLDASSYVTEPCASGNEIPKKCSSENLVADCQNVAVNGMGESMLAGDDNQRAATLTFENISFRVKKKEMKVILDDVSGFAKPGEMLALMGASGAGKSTLLDILAGRIRRDGKLCSGELKVNGQASGFKLKQIASYVMQEESLHPSLTVYETILFSAKLRLPNASRAQIRQSADAVIKDFGLSHVRNSLIGNHMMRGVSGGERRRVSIAVEAISHPYILFLDEPTSGLDSAAAYHICRTLRRIAREHNKTIIATIHQPSSETFELFDNLLLLVRGRTAYFGPRQLAPSYFAEIGHPVPELSNPSDHYLYCTNVDFYDDKDAAEQTIESIASRFAESLSAANVKDGIEKLNVVPYAGQVAIQDGMDTSRNGFLVETAILTHRTLIDAGRNIGIYWIRLAMYIMMAVMFGLFWWGISLAEYDVANRLNVHFMCVAFLAFMSVAAVPAFIEDRAVYLRERMNGAIRVWPYVIANSVVSVPFVFLISLVFSAICYPMCGFHSGAKYFFTYVAFLFLALMVAESMTVAVSAIVPHFIAALTICAAMNGFMMVAGGVLVSRSVMPDWLEWTNYLSYQKYSYESIVYNDLYGQNFYCTPTPGGCQCIYGTNQGDCTTSGYSVLAYFDYEDVDMWKWSLVLLAMYVFYRLVFYFALLCSGTRR